MKLIATADWHLSKSTPISRTDPDYFATCMQKVRQITKLQDETGATLCIAGDIFDNLRVTPYMINVLAGVLKGRSVWTVAGQHDMEYRNITDACAYTTLVQSKTIQHIDTKVMTDVKGISFNEEIPRNIECTVALVHKTVTENDPPFFLKDAIRAHDLMRLMQGAEVIICGDYHVPFVKRENKQVLVNCGSLMRKGKDQLDYQPAVWYIDTDTLDVQRIPLEIKPVEEVFSFVVRNEIQVQKETGIADMDKVIERLTQEDMKPSFENILMALAVEENLSTDDMGILRDVLNTVRSGA